MQPQPNVLMAVLQVAMFSVFVHAIIEVFKGISAVGLFGIFKELTLSLIKNTALSDSTIHTLVFALALIFCKVFEFGVMIDMLGVTKTGLLADWLDYIGTSSIVYVGADVFYAQIQKLRTTITTTPSA